MKAIIIIIGALLGFAQPIFAQNTATTLRKELPEIGISKDLTLHFISPEPITYVDLSSNHLKGDLPVKNVLRLKFLPDSSGIGGPATGSAGVVTIIGESFIAQYSLSYASLYPQAVPVQVNILPEHTRPLDVPGVGLTVPEMKGRANKILNGPENKVLRKAKAYGMHAALNQVYTAGDLIFLDITFSNRTNLPYEVDELRFKIQDRKINKATNVQSMEIEPLWQLYPDVRFKSRHRNIYVFKKVTFPGKKVLNVEVSEKQLSGRTLNLQIKYGDILEADKI